MDKITLENFKENKLFIVITVFLAILTGTVFLMEPEYLDGTSAFLVSVISFPLGAIWLQMFWNKIVVKIVKVPQISYGVAFLLSAALTLLLGY